MENKIDRRKLVTLLGGLAGVGAAATLVAHADQVVQQAPTSSLQKLPWPYKPIDPEAVAQRAFADYYKGECMYGTFEAVVGNGSRAAWFTV